MDFKTFKKLLQPNWDKTAATGKIFVLTERPTDPVSLEILTFKKSDIEKLTAFAALVEKADTQDLTMVRFRYLSTKKLPPKKAVVAELTKKKKKKK